MAGFIFSISSTENVKGVQESVSNGYFSALVNKDLDGINSKIVAASVMADYLTMKQGDNVYFLTKRKIYGVGKLINIGDDCKYKNYLEANQIETKNSLTIKDAALVGNNPCARWICFFEPENRFFADGVDMDDALLYKPNSFRMLRAFQDRSFIKIDDEENSALKEFLYIKNINKPSEMKFNPKEHKRLNKLNLNEYHIMPQEALIKNHNNTNGEANLEMLLEAYVIDRLNNGMDFDGSWDYVSHQVIASPFKPLAYIDKIDIFAYKFLKQYPHEKKPIEKFLLIELKKGKGNKETLLQAMRYVDWVCNQYASGDYSRISAYAVALNYTNRIVNEYNNCKRTYIKNTHPIDSGIWKDIKLLTYSVNKKGDVSFTQYQDLNEVL